MRCLKCKLEGKRNSTNMELSLHLRLSACCCTSAAYLRGASPQATSKQASTYASKAKCTRKSASIQA